MRVPTACLVASLSLLATCAREQPAAESAPAAAPAATNPAAPAPRTMAPAPPGPEAWRPSDDPKRAQFLGLEAPKPATWIEHPPSSAMRAANYTVPGRDGNEAAHIVVYYFGRGQGGTVEQNISRWQGQFRPHDDGTPVEPVITRFEADGMPVTLVELAGAWMMMGQTWYTEDQKFMTAVVDAPIGMVFIRFAGQTATVDANAGKFLEMVKGLKAAP